MFGMFLWYVRHVPLTCSACSFSMFNMLIIHAHHVKTTCTYMFFPMFHVPCACSFLVAPVTLRSQTEPTNLFHFFFTSSWPRSSPSSNYNWYHPQPPFHLCKTRVWFQPILTKWTIVSLGCHSRKGEMSIGWGTKCSRRVLGKGESSACKLIRESFVDICRN